MKTKPIECWAVVFPEKYDNGNDIYLPELYSSRKYARAAYKDGYPKHFIAKVKITPIKEKRN